MVYCRKKWITQEQVPNSGPSPSFLNQARIPEQASSSGTVSKVCPVCVMHRFSINSMRKYCDKADACESGQTLFRNNDTFPEEVTKRLLFRSSECRSFLTPPPFWKAINRDDQVRYHEIKALLSQTEQRGYPKAYSDCRQIFLKNFFDPL
jgi:hypothetical protein